MDEDTQRHILELIDQARRDAEAEPGDYSAVIDLLGKVEEATRAGGVPPELVGQTEAMSFRFPVLARPGMRGATRSHVPGTRDSSLVQLRNKLKELGGG